MPLKFESVGALSKPRNWRAILFVFASGVALYVITVNSSRLREGFTGIGSADKGLLVLACVCIAATFTTATGVYWMLSTHMLSYRNMLKIEIAGGFTSHLLPAGLGGVATNLRYLSKVFSSKTRAATVVALNNILSFASFIAAAGVVAILTEQPFNAIIHIKIPMLPIVLLGLLLLLVGLLCIHSSQLRQSLARAYTQLANTLNGYRQNPQHVLGAFLFACGTTCLYVSVLFVCAHALGNSISFLQAFIAFTLGITGSAITPTPGGLGGVELGLYTGLYSTGVSGVDALAIVLTYRLIAFWLPILPGFFMFRHLLKAKML